MTYPVGRARPLALLLAGLWMAALPTLALVDAACAIGWLLRRSAGGQSGGYFRRGVAGLLAQLELRAA